MLQVGHRAASLPGLQRPGHASGLPLCCLAAHPWGPAARPMLQVIGYIASHFRKDKIWMRRTRPDKRKYQVRGGAQGVAGRERCEQQLELRRHCPFEGMFLRRVCCAPPGAQVVVAVDDSRSMAETGCGAFALEALTLICRAMARLEVGRRLGVHCGMGSLERGSATPLFVTRALPPGAPSVDSFGWPQLPGTI